MFTQTFKSITSSSIRSSYPTIHHQARGYTWKSSRETEFDLEAACKWRKKFEEVDINPFYGKVTNDIKNSKAILNYPLPKLLPQVPQLIHDDIRASRYCRTKNSFIIEAGIHGRNFAANERELWTRIWCVILDISIHGFRGGLLLGNLIRFRVRDMMKILDAEYKASRTVDDIIADEEGRALMSNLIKENHKRKAIEKWSKHPRTGGRK